MLDYSRYHPAMIALSDKGDAFIYWMSNKLCALDEGNYGRGEMHWIEYLGKFSKADCEKEYPRTPVLKATDPRINAFLRLKIVEMQQIVQS